MSRTEETKDVLETQYANQIVWDWVAHNEKWARDLWKGANILKLGTDGKYFVADILYTQFTTQHEVDQDQSERVDWFGLAESLSVRAAA